MPTSLSLAIVIAAGTAAGLLVDPAAVSSARWIAAVFGFAAFLLASRGIFQFARWTACLALAFVCVLLGADSQHRALYPPLRTLLNDRLGGFDIDAIDSRRQDTPVTIEGSLAADASITEIGAAVRVHVQRVSIDGCPEPTAGDVSLTIVGTLAAESSGEWRAGRTIRASAVLRRPARYLNEGVADHERLLARRGIALVGSVKSAALVQVTAEGGWFDEWASSLRAQVRRGITRHVGARDPQAAAVAVAILIGDRGSLDPDVEQRLQEAGTYHVIAISGGNIAILAGVILGGLWLLGVRGGWAAAAAVIALAIYAFVAGGGPSVIRATVMAAIYLTLRVIDQRTAPVHAIALTAAAVILANPLTIADVGLWLTFGATIAIIAGASRIMLPRAWWLRAPAALVLASLCAELILLPIGAFVFQRVTVAGLVVNLAAVPCMAMVQIAAMITTLADWADAASLADAAGWATFVGVRGLIDSAALVDFAPWLTWRVPSPALIVSGAYYALLVAWFLTPHATGLRRPIAIAAGLSLIWIAVAPATLARSFGDGRLHLTLMDVGQGDAILVTLPNGRTLMVDTGGVSLRGEFDIGDRVLGPALRARGLGRLDYLAITHGDPDHLGGAMSIVRDFHPSEIWYGVFVNNHEPLQRLQAMASRRRSAWRWLQSNDVIELGDVQLRVHHPSTPDWQRQKVRNDDSLVMELRYRTVSMLLTGDIGQDVEQDLIAKLDLLPTVVLKSPHHGSGTSSSTAFIQAIKPKLVLISAGRGNPYGHPLPYVLERYRAVGAEVLRTDLAGQIEVVTDGSSVTTTTFAGVQMQPRRHEGREGQ